MVCIYFLSPNPVLPVVLAAVGLAAFEGATAATFGGVELLTGATPMRPLAGILGAARSILTADDDGRSCLTTDGVAGIGLGATFEEAADAEAATSGRETATSGSHHSCSTA